MKNDYLENRRQAQLNKARGHGYAGVKESRFSLCAVKGVDALGCRTTGGVTRGLLVSGWS